MEKYILRELLVSFALGGMPILVMFIAKGETQMLNRLVTLNPGDEIFAYFICLFLLHGLFYSLDKWLYKKNEHIDAFIKFAHGVTEQVGFGIHGIYRAITGAAPVALLLLIYSHGADGAAQTTLLSIILVVGGLFMCCLMSWLNEHTKPRRRFL